MTHQYDIISGPSKWDLAIGFFTNLKKRINQDFTIVPNVAPQLLEKSDKEQLVLRILDIGLEDGSGENFLIKGTVWRKEQTQKFSGYYSTRRRSGCLNFE